MNKFTDCQKKRISCFYSMCDKIPNLKGNTLILSTLSKILPEACPFQKAYWFRGRLIVFIPSLCQLNPFYGAILDYRYGKTTTSK